MLMNRKEITDWLKTMGEEPYIHVDRKISSNIYIPMRYYGIYDCAGIYTAWDEVGGVAEQGFVWKPVGGGTLMYEVRDR